MTTAEMRSPQTHTVGAVLTLAEGLPGFPHLSKLMLTPIDDYGIFVWLFADEPDELAFLAVNPFVYFPDYEFEVQSDDQLALQAEDGDELISYCLVSVDADRSAATANLLAPIVMNVTRSIARQIVLDRDEPVQAPLPMPGTAVNDELHGAHARALAADHRTPR